MLENDSATNISWKQNQVDVRPKLISFSSGATSGPPRSVSRWKWRDLYAGADIENPPSCPANPGGRARTNATRRHLRPVASGPNSDPFARVPEILFTAIVPRRSARWRSPRTVPKRPRVAQCARSLDDTSTSGDFLCARTFRGMNSKDFIFQVNFILLFCIELVFSLSSIQMMRRVLRFLRRKQFQVLVQTIFELRPEYFQLPSHSQLIHPSAARL